ncbi:hypothetical protein GQ44DRAFT_601683 [Phaeosphaeriaceae sp. PMI808]|nr:hypothetical protein GQ44DRAFT_601683 [Phaeosphaeriaceae sp. PMI808]
MAHEEPPEQSTIRLAEILSDLVSLRVCHPNAALALVSAQPHPSSQKPESESKRSDAAMDEQDEDLKRAKDLVKLHYDVREKHKRGELSRGLEEARAAVGRAVGG